MYRFSTSFILFTLFLSFVFLLPFTGTVKDPFDMDLSRILSPPTKEFPLGTDNLGRCLLSRTLHGGQLTILIGTLSTTLSMAIGAGVCLASLRGPAVLRKLILLVTDGWFAFPEFLMTLTVILITGDSPAGIITSMAISSWPWWSRFSRNMITEALSQDYVIAARFSGIGRLRLLSAYVAPKVLPVIITAFLLRTSRSIVLSGGIGFLGLGVQPPCPEWGAMIRDGLTVVTVAPWAVAGPAVGLVITVALLQWMVITVRRFTDYRGYTFV